MRNLQAVLNKYNKYFSIDKPWPQNYMTWIFNPLNTVQAVKDEHDMSVVIHRGVDVTIGDLHLAGSGVLTGDFGISTQVMRDHLITDILGPGLGAFLLLLPLILLSAMTLVLLQRWRRPQIDGLPRGHYVSTLVDDYKQRLLFSRL